MFFVSCYFGCSFCVFEYIFYGKRGTFIEETGAKMCPCSSVVERVTSILQVELCCNDEVASSILVEGSVFLRLGAWACVYLPGCVLTFFVRGIVR
ncbi:hypothetical protein BDU57DRAFT_513748, partial [Ampelomyces quisqualis]